MRLLFLAISLMLTSISSTALAQDDKGHVLSRLWKSYYEAYEADRPKDQAKVLERIKEEALRQHLTWDYYDAGRLYIDSRSRTDWKLRDELEKSFAAELEAFGEPVAVFTNMFGKASVHDLASYAEAEREKLSRTCNRAFYKHTGSLGRLAFGEALTMILDNDYDYVLWVLLSAYERDADVETLAWLQFQSRYPYAEFEEYAKISRSEGRDSRKGLLEAYAGRYAERAVSVLARQDLLEIRFSELRERNGSSSDFLKLRDDCKELVEWKKSLKAEEKLIAAGCRTAENILQQLEETRIYSSIGDGRLTIALRNLKSVKARILDDGKVIFEQVLANGKGSFYALDTVATALPWIDDGEYLLVCSQGGTREACHYGKHSLSIAVKRDSRGHAAYVTDYMSGEPVKSFSLSLLDEDGKTVATSGELSAGQGFAAVPQELISKMSARKWGYSLQARSREANGRTRLSQRHYIYVESPAETVAEPQERLSGVILTDRSAFIPGDTLRYKGILYRETALSNRTAGEGRSVRVTMKDPEGNAVGTQEAATNGFGSVAGEFIIPKGGRGGVFSLSMEADGTPLAWAQVHADELVFPSFYLTWDKNNCRWLRLAGNGVDIKGRISSYSGHSLSGAKASYSVTTGEKSIVSGELKFSKDGDFSINFPTGSGNGYASYYVISVKVTDSTGETLEFQTSVNTQSYIPLKVELANADEGSLDLGEGEPQGCILGEDSARLKISLQSYSQPDLELPGMDIRYRLSTAGESVASGETSTGELSIDLSGRPSGLYRLQVWASATSDNGKTYKAERTLGILKISDGEQTLGAEVASLFRNVPGEGLSIQMGATQGPVWAVAELYADGNVLLDSRMVTLKGEKGSPGSLTTVDFERKSSYKGELTMKIFYFRGGRSFSYSRTFERLEADDSRPEVTFTGLRDSMRPYENASLLIHTEPGTECAVSIFDLSTETVRSNAWTRVTPPARPKPSVYYENTCGEDRTNYRHYLTRGGQNRMMSLGHSPKAVFAEEQVLSDMVFEESDAAEEEGPLTQTPRKEFANTLFWNPFLYPDENGRLSIDFRTSGKLSRYAVQVFIHDKNMRNSVTRKEFTVTVPVRVSIVQPQYLYRSDTYVATVSVSNSFDKEVKGVVGIDFSRIEGNGKARTFDTNKKYVSIPAGGEISYRASLRVDNNMDRLGTLAYFTPEDDSFAGDAVAVESAVLTPVQTITEAHSAIFHPGRDDKDSIIRELRKMFVNMDGDYAEISEISILQMLEEAIPQEIEPESDDVVSLSKALFADYLVSTIPGRDGRMLSDERRAEIAGKISDCRNSNGGFAWLAGMNSSPVITAMLLERFARMGAACPEEIKALLPDAVRYVDRSFFSKETRPYWRGGLSLAQYLYLRSLYADVATDDSGADRKVLSEFRKSARAYLVPSRKRALNGAVFAKARRIGTLGNLIESEEGRDLAGFWGIRAFTESRLERSLAADMESLLQYAEPHKCGGTYFPNAVMPWRGLLESEIYAHQMLCSLLEKYGHDDIAEGIRLWMMVQKETQEWKADPAYIEALATVLQGSEETLETKVIALSSSRELPFAGIEAAGNGFSIRTEYYRENGKQPLSEGTVLRVGEKITARYVIHNDENRSFVKLTVPRSANLRPVDQTSGVYGWFTAQGYRSVHSDRTEFWFDSYPEDDTTITEEFFVTQEGSFQSAAALIESLYAPHYRANDKAGVFKSRPDF